MNPVWPWGGHRRFAYDLVRWMRPARIAELGVHWGTSFFTFAQAMKDGRMRNTSLVGVDTFEGEEHAGEYGPEVLETVRKIITRSFPNQDITLHKMLFSDALPKVEDESIDLLHIDGLHTFEAVKEDFETWLPKLAPEGIILFHDVAPDTGYGSTDYWNKLSAEHPGFAFEHSWGLGVLFPKGASRLEALEADGLADKLAAYPAIARADRADHELRDARRMAKERLETVNKQGKTQADLRRQLGEVRDSMVPKKAHERLAKRAEAAERMAEKRKQSLDKQGEAIRERTERIQELRKQLAASQRKAEVAAAAREELRARVKAQENRLAEVRDQRDKVREQNAKLRETIAARDAAIEQFRAQAKQSRESQAKLERLVGQMSEHLAALVKARKDDREAAAAERRELAEAVEQARRAGESAAAALSRRLQRLDTDAELLAMRTEHLEHTVSRLRDGGGASEETEDWLTGQPQRAATKRSPRRS